MVFPHSCPIQFVGPAIKNEEKKLVVRNWAIGCAGGPYGIRA